MMVNGSGALISSFFPMYFLFLLENNIIVAVWNYIHMLVAGRFPTGTFWPPCEPVIIMILPSFIVFIKLHTRKLPVFLFFEQNGLIITVHGWVLFPFWNIIISVILS